MKRSVLALCASVVVLHSITQPSIKSGIAIAANRAGVAAAVDEKNPRANADPLYLQLRAAKLSGESGSAENVVLKRDAATITLKSGTLHFLAPVEGRVTGAVFIGEGDFVLNPFQAMEQRHIGLLTGEPSLTEQFNKIVLRFTDSTCDDLKKQITVKTGSPDSSAQNALDSNRKMLRERLRDNLDARILQDLLAPAGEGLFRAFFDGKRYGNWVYSIDPLGAPFVNPEEVSLVCLSEANGGIWHGAHIRDHYKTPSVLDEDQRLIDLEHHKIEATARGKRLDAVDEVTFKARVDGARALSFDLFPRLRVSKVTDDKGRELSFIQEKREEDADFFVLLAEPIKKEARYKLTIAYGGDEAVSDSGGGNYTLDARTNWYPNSSFGDRATYEMTLKTPKGLTMVATGQPLGESEEGDMAVSRWKSEFPLAVAGFNFGKFKKNSVQDEKLQYTFEAYANRDLPDYLKELQQAVENAERAGVRTAMTIGSLNTTSLMEKARSEAHASVQIYSSVFGPLPYGRIALTQQPYPTYGQAWPMLVYMPLFAYLDGTFRHQLGLSQASDFFKFVGAHEVAHQWWGHIIGWKSYRDQWMSEGFSEFSASLFAQAVYKNDKFLEYWREQREQITGKNQLGKRPSDVGSVYMGYRLNTAKTGNIARAMIYPKGGFILHMLRMMMWEPKTGDQRFSAMMKDFVKTHYNQNVSTLDFQRVVERHMIKDMDADGNGTMNWFFNQWVYGNLIPDYKFDYRLEDAEGGQTKFVGKITQSNVNDNFGMRVPIYLDFDGNVVRLGSAYVKGNSSTQEFQILLPKRPRKAMLNYYEDVLCTMSNR